MQKTSFPVILLLALQIMVCQSAFGTGKATGELHTPKVNTVFHKLGERVIQLKTFQYGDAKDLVYINLHDDEITAINGAKKVLERRGGLLIKIENYRTRNIKFKLDGEYYTIDPNRMFSRIGIAQSLILFGKTNPKAIDEIEKFANRVLQLIPPKPTYIIALHNNSNGKYSINSYLPGGAREKDARTINVNPDLDADDFFLTTDSALFNQLTGKKFNTIWQDNEKAKRDGSLSVYCGERNIHYINCETEHGRQPEYDEMIITATSQIEGKEIDFFVSKPTSKIEEKKTGPGNSIPATKPEEKRIAPVISKTIKKAESRNIEPVANKKSPEVIAYTYRILPTEGHVAPKTNTEILFGEKRVGLIRSVLTDSARTITGKFEMNHDFPLYSNMDFFLFVSANNISRLELRIDPTRQRSLLNPYSASVNIAVRSEK